VENSTENKEKRFERIEGDNSSAREKEAGRVGKKLNSKKRKRSNRKRGVHLGRSGERGGEGPFFSKGTRQKAQIGKRA